MSQVQILSFRPKISPKQVVLDLFWALYLHMLYKNRFFFDGRNLVFLIAVDVLRTYIKEAFFLCLRMNSYFFFSAIGTPPFAVLSYGIKEVSVNFGFIFANLCKLLMQKWSVLQFGTDHLRKLLSIESFFFGYSDS